MSNCSLSSSLPQPAALIPNLSTITDSGQTKSFELVVAKETAPVVIRWKSAARLVVQPFYRPRNRGYPEEADASGISCPPVRGPWAGDWPKEAAGSWLDPQISVGS